MATLSKLTHLLEYRIDNAQDLLKEEKPEFAAAYHPHVEGFLFQPFNPSLGEIYKLVCEELKEIDRLIAVSKNPFEVFRKRAKQYVLIEEEVELARKQAILAINKRNKQFQSAELIFNVIEISRRKIGCLQKLAKTLPCFNISLIDLIASYEQESEPLN
ncbi:MAG TPA: hypothetical protein VLG44_00155 [Chlamydiales bacterium]|nr:hypothetical protein [Chlamydiales bacterium]